MTHRVDPTSGRRHVELQPQRIDDELAEDGERLGDALQVDRRLAKSQCQDAEREVGRPGRCHMRIANVQRLELRVALCHFVGEVVVVVAVVRAHVEFETLQRRAQPQHHGSDAPLYCLRRPHLQQGEMGELGDRIGETCVLLCEEFVASAEVELAEV